MIDKIKFIETLKLMTEIAKSQQNYLTEEEIKIYFGDMELNEQHYKHIYQYLGENKITVEGFTYQPVTVNEVHQESNDRQENTQKIEETKQTVEEISQEDSLYLKMYLEDISSYSPINLEGMQDAFKKLKKGDTKVKQSILEGYLYHIVEIAKGYQNKGILLQDLIQEGNIGLLQALEEVTSIENPQKADDFIREVIKSSMEAVINQDIEDTDWEYTVIAKTNLISEAAKYLAEDFGRVATMKELSEYSKIPEDEIKDILQLSLDAISVGTE